MNQNLGSSNSGNANSGNAKLALSSASALLAAQWVMAIVSIPSAKNYAIQIEDGVAPEKIVTIYDNFSLLISITIIWSWIATNRFLLPIYDQGFASNPTSMRLRRVWVIWGWVVPIVSFWFPKRAIEDLLKTNPLFSNQLKQVQKLTSTWWATWVSFILINNLNAINAVLGNAPRIQPAYELAAASMLTASYLGWSKIIRILAN